MSYIIKQSEINENLFDVIDTKSGKVVATTIFDAACNITNTIPRL